MLCRYAEQSSIGNGYPILLNLASNPIQSNPIPSFSSRRGIVRRWKRIVDIFLRMEIIFTVCWGRCSRSCDCCRAVCGRYSWLGYWMGSKTFGVKSNRLPLCSSSSDTAFVTVFLLSIEAWILFSVLPNRFGSIRFISVRFGRFNSVVQLACEALAEEGFSVVPYHKEVPPLERLENLKALRSGRANILVCTDLAARYIMLE